MINAIQPSFAAGELAPALYGRVDFSKYSSGLKTARNGYVHPEGGFSSRPGFMFVANAKYDDKACRVIPFEFSATQSYMIEFGDLYCRFYVNGGQIQSGPSAYEISTPYTEDELTLLKFTQSADTLYIAHPDHAPMTLVRNASDDWTLAAFEFVNGPFMAANATSIEITPDRILPATLYYLRSTAPLFTANHVGSLWKINQPQQAQSVSRVFTSAASSGSIFCGGNWRVVSLGTWAGSFRIDQSIDRGVTWTALSEEFTSASNFNINTFGTVLVHCRIRITCISLTSGTLTVNLSSDAFIQSTIYEVTEFSSSTLVKVAAPTTEIGYLPGYTADWAEGSWSVVRGWPSVVEFFSDRLVWGCSESEPQTIWPSQTGDYVNYGISDPLVDSDAISVSLPSRKLNGIKNLVAMTKLLPLTNAAEFSVGPGASGIFSPTSIEQRQQGSRGSSSVDAVIVGNQALYVQPMGSVIRALGFQFASDSFTGDNLSLLSSHLFKNFTILDLAYQQEPDSLIWAVRSDGELLCLTYMPEQQVAAWTRCDTEGEFESIATIPNGTYNELWAVVNRENGRFIERMAKRMPTYEVEDQFLLDCGITYTGAAATVITGLDHLEGLAVKVLADGSVQGPFTVTDGLITLRVAASIAHIGLPYTYEFETLNPEFQMRDGTSQGRKKRVSKVTIRFENSVGGYIGTDSTNIRRMQQRTTQALGDPIQLFTGDFEMPVPDNWQNSGRVYFKQADPLPVTILAVIASTDTGDI